MKAKFLSISFLLLLQFLTAKGTAANPDSLINKTITDSSDPKCICHQYQAIADTEYKLELIKEDSKKKKKQKGTTVKQPIKLRKPSVKKFELHAGKRKHENRSRKRHTSKRDPSRCFHW
jgi:hypothetical protein